MSDAARLDETYHYIISVFVERGQAPHYTEIAFYVDLPVKKWYGNLPFA